MDGIFEPSQQIIVVWLIYKAFEDISMAINPLSYVLRTVFHSIQTNSPLFSPKLGDIIGGILSSSEMDDIGEHTASEILESNFSMESSSTPDLVGTPLQTLTRTSSIIVAKADAKVQQITQHQLLKELLVEPSLWSDFEVPFMRTIPDLSPISSDELQFSTIISLSQKQYLFDEELSINKSTAAKSLMDVAKEKQLTEWQEDCVIEQMSEDKPYFNNTNYKVEDAERMMEVNPRIGGVMLAELSRKDPKIYDRFIDQDISEAICVGVKHILTKMTPPQNFLEKYIVKQVGSLTSIKDVNVLKPKIRLFCKLMVKLHEKSVQFSAKSLIELQSLQVELSSKNIPEVDSLSGLFE
ncbi:hypothetical protein TVAG_290270 [Trichomonas vaginalis G3]|uniref:CCR4-NOT transcription complex subunit 11 n=1 Tax=Trichomonas vaginalis (strain ATCC PRA-98 / G3) TaxID=412133 RepID=A2F7Q3_TRIV3|nr:gene silencing by RNA [Trichomonas vaginalis G3]EAX99080.1 hypothetical protein TVAG_290270 [Trichomonas vaginalis G3]KAI5535016.1 gene silencing by RNA [Trichomonas vaginalis G3]|eukprot:XP_001312010.1 hypothetical protein [Trichomonas vaginalis G3]